MRMDEYNSLVTKGHYACNVIEVDTACPLVPDTGVNFEGVDTPIFCQRFEYEHVHLFCAQCGCLGHRPIDCLSSQATPMTHPVAASNKPPYASREDVVMTHVDP